MSRISSIKIFLLSAVTLLWGYIFYLIYVEFFKGSSAGNKKGNNFQERVKNKINIPSTGSELQLNYEDPFLKREKALLHDDRKSGNALLRVNPAAQEPHSVAKAPDILYQGCIISNGINQKWGIFYWNSITHTLVERDTLAGYLILKIYKDSALVRRDGKNYIIRK
ncbi:MAG: hypothetical protein WC150_03220 [Bacteroidia bacterium]